MSLWTIFLHPRRIKRAAILVQPSTLLRYHHALIVWKYRLLYSSQKRTKPRPKGHSRQLIELVLAMKRCNPSFWCPKIAEQISKTFALAVDKDVVRRILAAYYKSERGDGPSWLIFLGQMKDSLWSIDFFWCESLRLKTHWVLVVRDHCTRRIIGFGIHRLLRWMGERCAACFIRPPADKGYPKGLAPIMTPCFVSTSGKPI